MNRIKEVRKNAKMTQVELASMAKISQPFLHDLESNHRSAKPETLERIAEALKVSVKELIEEKAG